MCGFVGAVDLDGRPQPKRRLEHMMSCLQHRGPDAKGIVINGAVGLGFRRLSILDLSPAGNQPMKSGGVVIVYNGEVYNYKDIRADLERSGVTFRSQSDTEVVLESYRRWGEACVEKFNGMFAFAIWDRPRKKLFLARDRYGIKPLYWYWKNGHFIFASEIKAILKHPAVKRRLSIKALDEYFSFQNIFTDRTLFENIRLLRPGYKMVLNVRSGGEPLDIPYWDYPFDKPTLRLSPAEAEEELSRLFEQAVKRQLVSDVGIGAYLSGGIDSGSIATVARKHLGRICTFTGGFDMSSVSGLELGIDERQAAEVMANSLKTEHYEMVMHAGDMEAAMPKLIYHLEDLRVGQSYPNYYIARLAGKFVKVVLSGAGGDELFAGYPWRYYRGMTSRTPEEFFKNYYGFWQRLVTDKEKPQLFNKDVKSELGSRSTFDIFRGVFRSSKAPLKTPEDFLNASLYFELKTFLHGLLVVEDKVSMAHSLETRVPFLDNDLVEFACRIPAKYKLRDFSKISSATVDEDDLRKFLSSDLRTGSGKAILRNAMRRLMPADVTERVKQGFIPPGASWFRGESIDYINRLLRNRKARIYDYLEYRYVIRILDEHCSHKENHRLLIWSFLSFEWWCRVYLEND